MKVLSLIPPMTQLNTPYPSTAYLTGFLRSQGVDAHQVDLALALVLALLTPDGLRQVRAQALQQAVEERSACVNFFLDHFTRYESTIAPTIAFLQGRDATLCHRISGRGFLPEGPRFAALDVYGDAEAADPLAWAFGALGQQDRARHLATLYLNDLADVLRDGLSMVYSFFEPSERDRSLGTFMILDNIARVRRLGLPFLYLGYWVRGSDKMGYKADFTPLEVFDGEEWRPLREEEI